MTAPKLTEAQRKHLTEMERRSAQHAFSGFDFPSLTVGQFKKLGYIAPVKIATATYYHVTDAGRAALRGES